MNFGACVKPPFAAFVALNLPPRALLSRACGRAGAFLRATPLRSSVHTSHTRPPHPRMCRTRRCCTSAATKPACGPTPASPEPPLLASA
eukprot:365680-Chlamydomonas_euryale.AAC.1